MDTPPELRLALLREGIRRVDAVALTHTHADHLMGMDDLRAFSLRSGREVPIHAERPFLNDVRRVFRYAFVEGPEGGGRPKLDLVPISAGLPFELLGALIEPLRVMHGTTPITSFRIGAFAYVTDVSEIPDETMIRLNGLDTLILGAIRDEPHSTHFNIPQAVEVVRQLRPRQAFFTHMTHDIEHQELSARLPSGIAPAHDGLRLTFPG